MAGAAWLFLSGVCCLALGGFVILFLTDMFDMFNFMGVGLASSAHAETFDIINTFWVYAPLVIFVAILIYWIAGSFGGSEAY